MTLLAESIGPGGIKQVWDEPFPSLALLDTEEIIEKMGKVWKIPEPFGSHKSSIEMFAEHDRAIFRQTCDDLFSDWIRFCNGAIEGFKIGERFLKEHKLSGDYTSVCYATIFHDALGSPKKNVRPDAENIRDAFIILLSPDAKKKFKLEGKKSKKVSDSTRSQINLLVKNMRILANYHHSKVFHQLAEFEDD